ncbi:MAG TPA: ABC transporter ATP-binding protein [Acidimicrobiales bacterium]|nr:ABC transporter ATP-binding protein [Acidimicrobiales bacterium]
MADPRSAAAGAADEGAVVLVGRELGKTFTDRSGSELVALSAVDFEVRRGELVTLVGPSGCGKSTLLNLVGGLLDRSGGTLAFEGSEIDRPRPEIGMMFQAPVLFPWRTALDNTLLPIDIRRQKRALHKARALDLLELVGLSSFADNYPNELSGGMQQRVALARLLLQDPELLLLDEPFGALDEFTREDMNLMLLDIWASTRKTAMLVTHNIQEAIFLADRVFVMSPRPGRLVEIISVDLPRPRTIAMMRAPEFQDMVFEVRKILGAL